MDPTSRSQSGERPIPHDVEGEDRAGRDGAELQVREKSDGALLAEFLQGRQEAFAELVTRHGALVHGVCLRTLANPHDAEDAAQATFLLLSAKARTLAGRKSLAGWLHIAAHNVARTDRAARNARVRREEEAGRMSPKYLKPQEQAAWRELRPVLDAELGGLPEGMREAILLHHVEGQSIEVTARQMGRPAGTVATWLSRGLARLRERLARRGTVLPAALLVLLLQREASASGLSAAATQAVLAAAPAVAAQGLGAGAVSGVTPHVVAWAQGTLQAMLYAKLKVAALLLAALASAACAGGWYTYRLCALGEAPTPSVEVPGSSPPRGAAAAAAARSAEVQVKQDEDRLVLSNEHISLVILPGGGMYVPEATDLKTGKRLLEGLKLNFPYFEHGIKSDQTAGFRILRHPDGSVTVAMNMRFCHHRGPKEIERYGRFAERSLSEFVTLRPGEALFEFRGRVDNPTPLRRSYRLWDRYLMPVTDETRFLMPVSHGVEHSAHWIQPWPQREVVDPATQQKVIADFSLRKTWTAYGRQPTQYFGLYADHGFLGVWSPEDDIARLRAGNPVTNPGVKIYCSPGIDMCEPWGGTTVVVEDPGGFIEGFVPCEMAYTCYLVAGLGPPSYADRNLAVRFEPQAPSHVRVATPRTLGAVVIEVTDGERPLAQTAATLGPGTLIRLETPAEAKRLAVRVRPAGGSSPPAEVWQTPLLPLEIKDKGALYQKLKAACDARSRIDYIELQEHSNLRGLPAAMSASDAAAGWLKSGSGEVAAPVSLANACYRIGDFAKASALADRVLATDAANEHAFHVKGLIAFEEGRAEEAAALLAKAGVQAHYVRALQAVAKGDRQEALGLLETLVQARPAVYRPRLLRAYLKAQAGARDEALASARVLADENPAYPEAQEVLHRVAALAGAHGAAGEAAQVRDALLRNNPDAQRQLDLFRLELDKGTWVYVGRYAQPLPSK